MPRSGGRYSEGELSDSPVDMADDISLSLSEDEHNRDVLDIKPPQPQAGSRSKSKPSSRDRGYDRRGSSDQRSSEKRSRDGSRQSKEERRAEHRESRESRDSRKEDLRERLERERRLRMSTKEREEPSDARESDERRRYSSSHKKDRSATESRSRKDYSVEEQSERDRQREDRHRRRRAEVQVVSSPESDTQVEHKEEQPEEVEASKESSSSSSDSSDEGEASSSNSSSSSSSGASTASDEKGSSPEAEVGKSNGQHRSPNSAAQENDNSLEDEEPEVKRRKEEPSQMDVEPPAAEEPPHVEEEKEEELPPYLPAIMGCRSVGEFQCLNKIEEGTYGVVYRAQDKRTNEIVALKRLKMEREKEGFPITSLREVSTLLKAQHENIVTVREIVVGSNMDSIFMVMDYVEHDLKSLMEVLKTRKQFFLPGEVKCLLIQLLRAVAHLHDNWILHRDLKTSNILLSHSGILKVGDFGLAREYGSPLKAYTAIVVTLWYRAPELLLGVKEYSTPIDVWSVGCIFGELLTLEAIFQGKFEADQVNKIFRELGTPNDNVWAGYSELPFVKKATFVNNPVSNLRKRFSSRLSELGVDLLQKFLTYDPQKRITAEDALKHTYLKEQPYPIHPSMLPTWPAKSESHGPRKAQSPKPPSGGRAFKQLGDNDNDVVDVDSNTGFHMGGSHVDRNLGAGGVGFSLKF